MDSPMPPRSLGTLGSLTLVGRKDGKDVQSFPIDSERVTIGRDYECDIRLYFSDVSKLHCEIVFDLLTDKASLHVHGSNGVYIVAQDDERTFYQAPTLLPLSDGDRIIVRKKIFRFNYGTSSSTFETPSKNAPTPRHLPTPNFVGMREMLAERVAPPTPNFVGMKEMLAERIAPPTPSLIGMREMLAEHPAPPTPSFVGMREMLADRPSPMTPNFAGMKQLLAERIPPSTPSFVGIRDMYRTVKESGEPGLQGVAELFEASDSSDEEVVVRERSQTEERMANTVDDDDESDTSSRIIVQTPLMPTGEVISKSPHKDISEPRIQTRQTRAASVSATSRSTRSRRGAKAEQDATGQSKSTTSRSTRKATEEASETPMVLAESLGVSEESADVPSKPTKRKAAPKAPAEPSSAPSRSRAKKVKEEKENDPEEPVVTKAPRRAAAKKATEVLAERSVSTRTTRSRK